MFEPISPLNCNCERIEMLKITEAAEEKIASLIAANDQAIAGLRVGAQARSPFKTDYRLAFMAAEQVQPDFTKATFNGFDVYMDAESTPLLEEAIIDYVEGMAGSGFKIDNPNQLPDEYKGTVAEKVMASVAGHGGHVTLMDVKDNVVYVELGGGCQGCGMAKVTLKEGIEKAIKEAIPEIAEVRDVTDHGMGDSPYYEKEAAE